MTTAEKLEFINRYCNRSISITCYTDTWSLHAFKKSLFYSSEVEADSFTELIGKAYDIIMKKETIDRDYIYEKIENDYESKAAKNLLAELENHEDDELPEFKKYVPDFIKHLVDECLAKEQAAYEDAQERKLDMLRGQ